MLMADHLNAHSTAVHIAGHQDRSLSRLPSGSDVILATFQIKKLLCFRLILFHRGGKKDSTDKKAM